MSYWVLFIVFYLLGLGVWLYFRFWKKKGGDHRVKSVGGHLVVEHEGKKIIVDYDVLTNKVLLEFTEGGMVFRVVDGLFKEPMPTESVMSLSPGVADPDVLEVLDQASQDGISKL